MEAANKTNGATTAYTVAFVPALTVESDDHFTLTLPRAVSAPKEPVCRPVACVAAVTCISEQDRIIAQLAGPSCGVSSEVKFVIEGMRNPYSAVRTFPFAASLVTAAFMDKAIYRGRAVTIENTVLGAISNNTVSLVQQDRNYEVVTTYTLRFKPTNPIPSVGAVRVVYPATITIPDPAAFLKSCQAQTSVSFTGQTYCKLDASTRSVWFLGIFQDQESWTSQIALFMDFANPASNFHATVSEEDQSFHITTYEPDQSRMIDLKLKDDQGDADLTPAKINSLMERIIREPFLAKGID